MIIIIITGKELDLNTSEFLINCVKRGEESYDEKLPRGENKENNNLIRSHC